MLRKSRFAWFFCSFFLRADEQHFCISIALFPTNWCYFSLFWRRIKSCNFSPKKTRAFQWKKRRSFIIFYITPSKFIFQWNAHAWILSLKTELFEENFNFDLYSLKHAKASEPEGFSLPTIFLSSVFVLEKIFSIFHQYNEIFTDIQLPISNISFPIFTFNNNFIFFFSLHCGW